MASPRHPRNLDAGPLWPMIKSHQLELARIGRSAKTLKIYREAAQWFAAELLLTGCEDPALEPIDDWTEVTRDHLRAWSARLFARGYSDGYVSNQWRALQALFKFIAEEEEIGNVMLGMKPPEVKPKPVPVFGEGELEALLATAKGRDFTDRRDLAIMLMLKDTGIRLAECAGLALEDLALLEREATVTGKGDKTRTVKYTYEAARALDRYIRVRERQPNSHLRALWLGPKGRLTDSGIYQIVERRGEQAGIKVNPHRFRHHFSHTWLDRGGAEGDLMELNGWDSPQMLRRYGRSAASARARRGYDRVMGED
jgi:site-specific recombinase XerD